jgi:azurin
MASQPDGFQKHFVPDSPDVLHATKLINHGEIARLRFTAPAQGKYPYVCTFPGHWRTMNGVMDVVRPAAARTEARR